MKKIKVSAVNYLNSQPFIFGLKNSAIKDQIELELDIPSVCAEKLLEEKADIGLVPVAVLPELDEYHFISDYCIGSDGAVGSVLLLSDVPLNEIKNVLLDYQSKTSVLLVQVLAEKFWNIKPHWSSADVDFEKQIQGSTAGVVIPITRDCDRKIWMMSFLANPSAFKIAMSFILLAIVMFMML